MVVLGIDPGLRVTGLVWITGRAVVRAEVLRARPPARAGGFTALQAAAVAMARRTWEAAGALPAGLVAVEGWENQGIERAAGADRHHVPVLLGALAALAPGEVVWQRASVVLGPSGYGWLMKPRVQPAIRGWAQQITNEHLRSAACHALAAQAASAQMRMAAVPS